MISVILKSSEVLTLCFNFYSNEKKTVLFSFSLSAIEEDSNIRNSEAWAESVFRKNYIICLIMLWRNFDTVNKKGTIFFITH